MRRTFLYPDRDTFDPAHRQAALTLARGEDGTCLADLMAATGLGRTAAISLLHHLCEEGTLYSVRDAARRHLRYHPDGFDLDPAEARVELEPLLLRALEDAPTTAQQLAAALRLPLGQVRATLEDLRARQVVVGPRTQGARIYRVVEISRRPERAVPGTPAPLCCRP